MAFKLRILFCIDRGMIVAPKIEALSAVWGVFAVHPLETLFPTI
jgi:hypothetical protein